jgi:hypothetical protein
MPCPAGPARLGGRGWAGGSGRTGAWLGNRIGRGRGRMRPCARHPLALSRSAPPQLVPHQLVSRRRHLIGKFPWWSRVPSLAQLSPIGRASRLGRAGRAAVAGPLAAGRLPAGRWQP